MAAAALVTWILTAGGGFALVALWASRGGVRQQETGVSQLRLPLVLGHAGLAAVLLVLWIVYLATDAAALRWVAFVGLLLVAALGFTMFARWLAQVRRPDGVRPPVSGQGGTEPAEATLPVPVVLLHGLLGAVTLVLVLLTALRG